MDNDIEFLASFPKFALNEISYEELEKWQRENMLKQRKYLALLRELKIESLEIEDLIQEKNNN